MRVNYWTASVLLIPSFSYAASPASSSEQKKTENHRPCTAQSSTSGNFFDLNPLWIHPLDPESKKSGKTKEPTDWSARGHDFGYNFTLNFCGPLVEELDSVEDISRTERQNVSAIYTKGGRTYSIGQNNDEPFVRGRKLVLRYTDGSYCEESQRESDYSFPHDASSIHTMRRTEGRAPGHDKRDQTEGSLAVRRRKSTIISLLCERSPKDSDPKVAISFVDASPDECTYFFEARTPYACPTQKPPESQNLGPGGVFGVIATIAILAYLVGGIVYQRVVQHQRGWRQVPNYALWSSMLGFVRDMVIIVTASISRCIPGLSKFGGNGRKGYSRVGNHGNGGANGGIGRGLREDSDAENRLIDQLDEDWDD